MNEENQVQKTDVKPVKKSSTVKKAAPKKVAAKPKVKEQENEKSATVNGVNDNSRIIVFESGTAYVSGDIRFTKDNRIQEVPNEDAVRLLELDNFRLANQFEIEDFLASKED